MSLRRRDRHRRRQSVAVAYSSLRRPERYKRPALSFRRADRRWEGRRVRALRRRWQSFRSKRTPVRAIPVRDVRWRRVGREKEPRRAWRLLSVARAPLPGEGYGGGTMPAAGRMVDRRRAGARFAAVPDRTVDPEVPAAVGPADPVDTVGPADPVDTLRLAGLADSVRPVAFDLGAGAFARGVLASLAGIDCVGRRLRRP